MNCYQQTFPERITESVSRVQRQVETSDCFACFLHWLVGFIWYLLLNVNVTIWQKKKKNWKSADTWNMSINVPQLASSELSWQSLSPSQMYAGFVQIPVPHWNWPGLHLKSAVGRNVQMCSYDTWVWLWKRLSYNPHNHSRQSAGSSDRSPQSSSVSHFHQNGIHLSFLHTNWGEMSQVHISNEKVWTSLGLGLTSLMIMPSPGWRCSSTCTVSHQRPGRSYSDRHIYSHHPETADTSYCSRHCLSDMGDSWLTGEKRAQHYRQGRR